MIKLCIGYIFVSKVNERPVSANEGANTFAPLESTEKLQPHLYTIIQAGFILWLNLEKDSYILSLCYVTLHRERRKWTRSYLGLDLNNPKINMSKNKQLQKLIIIIIFTDIMSTSTVTPNTKDKEFYWRYIFKGKMASISILTHTSILVPTSIKNVPVILFFRNNHRKIGR